MALSDYPLIPTPNPGEGGPLPTFPENEVRPDVPLPDPGEGGPLPTVPEDENKPVVPLPNPGEGGSVPTFPNRPGSWLPGLIWPQGASVRFLNAAYGYPAFRVLIEGSARTRFLSYAAVSDYSRVASGYRTITVAGPDGYVYLRKSLPFHGGSVSTVAVVNRPGGLELVQISDSCCKPGGGYSNIRLSNLAYRSRPMDMLLADGRTVFADVGFKHTTPFKRIRPGSYEFLFADTSQEPMPLEQDVETLDSAFIGMEPLPETAASLYLDVGRNTNYSVFLLSGGAGQIIVSWASNR